MQNQIRRVLWGLIGLVGCTAPALEPDFDRVGYSYFPQEVGAYRDYWIEDITIPLVGEADTTVYYLREQVAEVLVAAERDTTWLLERYSRSSEEHDWRLDSLWQARRTATTAVVTANNVPYLKVVFPTAEDKVWDGHALNTQERQEYFMERVGLPYRVDSVEYPTTVTVIQSNNRDTLEMQNFVQEIYAQHIGMVLRESRVFRYCSETDCFGQQIIETGRSFRQRLIAYGKE